MLSTHTAAAVKYPVHTQILEEVIKHRWGALPDEQREGIKNYISNLIIKLATADDAYRQEKVTLLLLWMMVVDGDA